MSAPRPASLRGSSGPERTVACPWCRSPAGAACTERRTRTRLSSHPSRVDAWATNTAACPACSAAAGEACVTPGTDRPHPYGAHRERLDTARSAA